MARIRRPPKELKVQQTVHLSQTTGQALRKYQAETGMTQSNVVEKALRAFFKLK